MSRKSIKQTLKKSTTLSKISYKKNNIYVGNLGFGEITEVVITPDNPKAEQAILYLSVVGIVLNMMAQIRISARNESAEYTDQLPSYKDIKRKIIAAAPGKYVAGLVGVLSSLPYLMQDSSISQDNMALLICQLCEDMSMSNSPNTKRVRPNISNWQEYAKGEAGSALGQLLSCPATNLKLLNIDGSKVSNYGINEALMNLGIPQELLNKYDITTEVIKDVIRSLLAMDSSGIPISAITYEEPNEINSKIQDEILSDIMSRTGVVNTRLEKGMEPESSISKIQIDKYLTKYELIAYNFAIRSGDKNILKKYTDLVKQRSLKSSEIKGNKENKS